MTIPRLFIARTADGTGLALPSYTSAHHIALNLQAAISAPIRLNAMERAYIPVGFAIGIPKGYCGQVVSVPTLAKEQGVIVLGAPQILHPADRGALFILIQNTSHNPVIVHRGLICAQLLIFPAVQVCWNELNMAISDEETSSSSVVLDAGGGEEDKSAMTLSPRRQAHSIRHRFQSEGESGEE